MAGSVGLEPTSDDFGDRYVTITPRTCMAAGVRFERTHIGVKVRGLNRLATPLYGGPARYCPGVQNRALRLSALSKLSSGPYKKGVIYTGLPLNQCYLFVGRYLSIWSFAFVMVSYLLLERIYPLNSDRTLKYREEGQTLVAAQVGFEPTTHRLLHYIIFIL